MSILVFVIVALGLGSTLCVVVVMIGTLIYKIYRKIRFGSSLFN